MEKDDEIKGEENSYTTEYRHYDPRLSRWVSPDPIIKSWESPYAAYSNNPIYFIDPSGLSSESGDDKKKGSANGSTTETENPQKLTGSRNLIIYLKDANHVNKTQMDRLSGKYDYIVAGSLSEAKDILQKRYPNKKGFVSNLVIRTHGADRTENGVHATGMIATGEFITDPKTSSAKDALQYFKDITAEDANIMLTACAGCKVESSGKAFADFLVGKSSRSLYMNYTSTNARKYVDKNKNDQQDYDENEWFNFDDWTVRWPGDSGFKRWHYSTTLKHVSTDQVFYDIKIKAATGNFEFKKLNIDFKVDGKVTKPYVQP